MIRRCTATDLDAILRIVNDAARKYRGVIPADRWHEPYMPREETSVVVLRKELAERAGFEPALGY